MRSEHLAALRLSECREALVRDLDSRTDRIQPRVEAGNLMSFHEGAARDLGARLMVSPGRLAACSEPPRFCRGGSVLQDRKHHLDRPARPLQLACLLLELNADLFLAESCQSMKMATDSPLHHLARRLGITWRR